MSHCFHTPALLYICHIFAVLFLPTCDPNMQSLPRYETACWPKPDVWQLPVRRRPAKNSVKHRGFGNHPSGKKSIYKSRKRNGERNLKIHQKLKRKIYIFHPPSFYWCFPAVHSSGCFPLSSEVVNFSVTHPAPAMPTNL